MSQPDDYVSIEGLLPPKNTLKRKVEKLVKRFYDQQFRIGHVVKLAMAERTFKGYDEDRVYQLVKGNLRDLINENKVTRIRYGVYANKGEVK